MPNARYDFIHKNRYRLLIDIATQEGTLLRKGTLVHRIESPDRPSLPYVIHCEFGTFRADDVVVEKEPGKSYADSMIEKRVGEKYIILERAEGPSDLCGKPVVVRTFAEASKVLADWARTAPKTGGYDKTDFIVFWNDGETYEGRADLQYRHVGGYDLRAHIRGFVSFHAGLQRPAHLTQEQYDRFMTSEGPEAKESAVQFLGRYDI